MEEEIEDLIIQEWREFYIDYPQFKLKINQFLSEKSKCQIINKNTTSEVAEEEIIHLREKLLLPSNKKDKEDFIDIFCKDINKVQFFFNESYMNNSVRLEKIKEQLNYIKINRKFHATFEPLELALKELFKQHNYLEQFLLLNLKIKDELLKLINNYLEIYPRLKKNNKQLEEFSSELSQSTIKLDYLKKNIAMLFESHFKNKYKSQTNEVLDQYISNNHFSNFQFYVFIGIISIIILLIVICCIISYHYNIDMDSDSEFKSIFPMFRAFFVICLYFWLLGINVYVWNNAKINYKLAFQFTNHYSSVLSICKRAACFSAIFVLFYIVYMTLKIKIPFFYDILSFIPLDLTPLFTWIILLIYILSPFKGFFNYKGRYYMFNLFLESMSSIFISIEFKHVWFTDQLTSFIGPLRDMEYTLCYYVHYQNPLEEKKILCSSSRNVVLFIGVFPHIIRVLQCLRIMIDTKSIYPTIINTIKYCLAIAVAIISFIGSNSLSFTIIWITVATISTVVSFGWDLKMDFGLLQKDSKVYPLRDRLYYKTKAFYYSTIIINFVLRFMWILSMSPEIVYRFIRPELFSLIIFSLEVIRRGIWNLIRVEFKHFEICKQFKVTMNVELPFKKDKDGKLRLRETNIVNLVKMNKINLRLSNNFLNNIEKKEILCVNYESLSQKSDTDIAKVLNNYLEKNKQ